MNRYLIEVHEDGLGRYGIRHEVVEAEDPKQAMRRCQMDPLFFGPDELEETVPGYFWEAADGSSCKVEVRSLDGGDGHRLYERNTWDATRRLRDLRSGAESLEVQDVLDLFAAFVDGSEEAGAGPLLRDFGAWLAARDDFAGLEPAEVVW